jgi:hypothetical protein
MTLLAEHCRRHGLNPRRVRALAEARRAAALADWAAEARAAERHQCDPACGIHPEAGCPCWQRQHHPITPELQEAVRQEVALALEGLERRLVEMVRREIGLALAGLPRKGGANRA